MGGECIEDGAMRNGELVSCRFWVHILGRNPQTGETLNSGDCAISWMPVLLIENSKVNRETGAAVESLRNESITASQQVAGAINKLADTGRNYLEANGYERIAG